MGACTLVPQARSGHVGAGAHHRGLWAPGSDGVVVLGAPPGPCVAAAGQAALYSRALAAVPAVAAADGGVAAATVARRAKLQAVAGPACRAARVVEGGVPQGPASGVEGVRGGCVAAVGSAGEEGRAAVAAGAWVLGTSLALGACGSAALAVRSPW